MTRRFLLVQGIVQGVGFRPFVYRLARSLGITGHVENTTQGVEIEVQGAPAALASFVSALRDRPPPMARIHSLETADAPTVGGEQTFEIRSSRLDPVSSAVVPPDIATCSQCIEELFDPLDRRFQYPFLNCTNCGPRYTVIAALPYDRGRTSLAQFTLCPDCAKEFADPADRRFHAQPTACPRCGPTLKLLGVSGGSDRSDSSDPSVVNDPLGRAVAALRGGGIIALMGLGGFHLACDATSEAAVAELRRRKKRPAKPLAVMIPDLPAARELAFLVPEEETLLTGPRAPIVLARARAGNRLAPSVSPRQDRVGLFLPYTPLHHLLFRRGQFRALVMTSGNRSDEPILSTQDEAVSALGEVADLFLVHDRPILHRVDDSVVKPVGSWGPVVLRRARGYAPAPVPLPNPAGRTILALGAELANTVAVVRGNYAYLSPHFGDLKNLAVEEVFREGTDHLLQLLGVTPDLVVCDRHPAYRSSRVAREWEARGVPVAEVQHHEAHAAACMAENKHWDEGVILALDGLGYGGDDTLWGGEILAGRPGRFRRAGHLLPVPQPGGDRAAFEPWRMAASHLRRLLGAEWKTLPFFQDRSLREREGLDVMIARGLQSPLTSSCGRLFDAAAAILGFSGPLLYSAQAAMELESLAAEAVEVAPYPCGEAPAPDAALVLDPRILLQSLTQDALSGRDRAECARAFHGGLAQLWSMGAAEACRRTGCRHVFLTGGCMQNSVFVEQLTRNLTAQGLEPRAHREIPPNDAGVSYGQAAWIAGAARD